MPPDVIKEKLNNIHDNFVTRYNLNSPLTSRNVREFYVIAFEHLLLLSLEERLEKITNFDYQCWNEIRLNYKERSLSKGGLEKIKDIKKDIKKSSKNIVSSIMMERTLAYIQKDPNYGPFSTGKSFYKFGREVLTDVNNSGKYIRSRFNLHRSIEEILNHNDNLYSYKKRIKHLINNISATIDSNVLREYPNSRLLGLINPLAL